MSESQEETDQGLLWFDTSDNFLSSLRFATVSVQGQHHHDRWDAFLNTSIVDMLQTTGK